MRLRADGGRLDGLTWYRHSNVRAVPTDFRQTEKGYTPALVFLLRLTYGNKQHVNLSLVFTTQIQLRLTTKMSKQPIVCFFHMAPFSSPRNQGSRTGILAGILC